jgi:putative DNA primase/helicase
MGGEISAFDEHPTDLGNSRVLVRLNEGDIRYCHAFKAWFIWTGTYWRRDDNGEVMRRAAGAVQFMLSSAIALDHEDPQRGPRIGWALASERRQRLSDMKALAQDDERAVLDYRLLDADPLLIGVLNGVVDLRTGEFRESRREDFITKRANVNYEPDAKCPNWLKFQEKISGAHPGLIDYKQRAFGLTLSGEVPEILWICHGSGSNGKTTELETISDILGDYAHASDASILIAEKNQGGATPEIVALKDKRAVFVNETGQNDWLNEARVKYISATDTMSGRNLFEGIVNWKPTHKPFLRTNHRPKVKGTDLGIWRRIHYVPYTLTISRSDAILNFKETCLIPEKAGIFNWMLGGWLAYLNSGRKLNPPQCVQEANESYQKDSDITGRWIDSAIKPAPGAKVSLKQLHDAYVLWFRGEIGEKGYIAIQTLANRLEDKGYIREKSSSHSKGTFFADLRMVPMFPEMDAALDTMPNHGVFKERGDGGIQQSISQSISHTRVTRETLGKTPSDAPIPPIEYEEEEHPHMSSRNHPANFLEGNIPKTAPKKPKAAPKPKKVKVYDTEWSPSDPPPETLTGQGAAGLFAGYVRATSPLTQNCSLERGQPLQ